MASSLLTPKQEAFVQAYLLTGIASDAYRKAYPATKMSDKTVWESASRLLANSKVVARVEALRKEQSEKFAVTKERVIAEVAKIAFFDIRSIFNDDGSLKHIKDLDDAAAAAIAGMEAIQVGDDGQLIVTKKFKMSDKNVALEKLMKHLGLYELDNQQKKDPLADLLASLKGNITGVAPADALPGVGLDVPEEDE